MFPKPKNTDEQLVRRVLAGRREDFGLLVQRHLATTYAVAYARTGNHADADDVAQEAFLEALKSLDTLRDPTKFSAWLTTIARHTANRANRKREREAEATAEASQQEAADIPDMARRELRALVRTEVDKLDPDKREVLFLAYFAGKNAKEIATTLDITHDAARKRLERARESLGTRLLAQLGNENELAPLLSKRTKHITSLALAAAVPWKAAAAAGIGTSITAFKLYAAGCVVIASLASGLWFVTREAQTGPPETLTSTTQGTENAAQQTSPPDTPAAQVTPSVPPKTVSNTKTEATAQQTPSADASATQDADTGSIAGRVVDVYTSEAIPGVGLAFYKIRESRVRESPRRLLGSFGPSARATTDTHGAFRVSELLPGNYSIRVHDGVWLTAVDGSASVAVKPGSVSEEVIVSAQKGAIIAGRVYDAATDQGIQGVTLETAERKAVSDEEGRYTITGLRTGRRDVRRENVLGYSEVIREDIRRLAVKVGDAVTDVDFALYQGLSVTGTVVNTNGESVPGAEVLARVSTGMGNFTMYHNLTALTEADGGFVIRGFVPDMQISLEATAPGLKSIPRRSITLQNEDTSFGEVLVYAADARISGRVTDTFGSPLANALILYHRELKERPGSGSSSGPITADDSGGFSFDGLLAGEYKLSAIKAGDEPHSDNEVYLTTVELDYSEHVDNLELRYDPHGGLSISGTLTDSDGRAVADAQITAIGPTVQRTTSDVNGFYILENLVDGDCSLTIDKGAFRHVGTWLEAGVDNGDLVLDIADDTSFDYVIVGTVLSANTGEPILNFGYDVNSQKSPRPGDTSPPPSERFHTIPTQFLSVVDSGGNFRIPRRHVADYAVMVTAKGFAGQNQYFSIVSGPQKEYPLEFRLHQAAPVEGRVFDPSGNPLEGALIMPGLFEPNDFGTPDRALAQTDADGRFRVEWLETLSQDISVYHTDYNVASTSIAPLPGITTHVAITMPGSGSVQGSIRLDGELFDEQISVTINYVDEEMNVAYSRGGLVKDGAYQIQRLPPGEIFVRAISNPYGDEDRPRRTMRKPAVIKSGGVTRVDFDLVTGNGELVGTIRLDAEIPTTASCVLTYQLEDGEDIFALYKLQDGQYDFTGLPAGTAVLTVRATMGSEEDLRRPWLAEPFSQYTEYIDVEIRPGEWVLDVSLSSETSEAWHSQKKE